MKKSLEQFSERIGILEVEAAAKTVKSEDLLSLMKGDDDRAARNAAWTMTHKEDSEVRLLPQDELISLALSTESVPLRRLTLNLLERQEIKEEDLRSDFLDFCLARMTSLDEPPGVQSLCMKLAHRMCSFYPELLHEFNETIRLMPLEHYTPGLKSVIAKLKKQ